MSLSNLAPVEQDTLGVKAMGPRLRLQVELHTIQFIISVSRVCLQERPLRLACVLCREWTLALTGPRLCRGVIHVMPILVL